MPLTKNIKTKIISTARKHATDTGSAQVQVSLLSRRIDELTKHLKTNKKDVHSRRGLLKLVSQRRGLLDYLQKKEAASYEKTIKKLGLKK